MGHIEEKFFFNINNFDEEEQEEQVDLNDPDLPRYSENQYQAAIEKSFKDGQKGACLSRWLCP